MTSPARARTPAVVVVDLMVGIVSLLFAFLLGVSAIDSLVTVRHTVGVNCTRLGCDPAQVSVYVIAGIAVLIFAFALGLGVFVVRAIQRRWAWLVPVIALVVMIVVFYIDTFLIHQWAAGVGT